MALHHLERLLYVCTSVQCIDSSVFWGYKELDFEWDVKDVLVCHVPSLTGDLRLVYHVLVIH